MPLDLHNQNKKPMRKFVYAFLIIGTLGLSGCTLPQMVKMAKEQQLTATPNPLEVHKDTVALDMAVSLPVKMLKKGTIYSVNTYYKFGEQEKALDPISFKAEDYPNSSTEQPKVTKSFTFAYTPAMKSGVLQVEGVATKSGKSKVTPRMDVAVGVITTSKLVKPVYYAAFAEHGYNNKEEIIPIVIPDFIFEQGRSVLRPSETKTDKGKQLDAFIASKNVTRTVTITGTHSPEGAERINSKLSPDRAKAIEKYYRDQMKKYDYKDKAKEIQFIHKPIIQDWAGFKAALASYEGITSEEKAEYMNIINGGGTFESAAKQITKLKTYKKVFKDVYPKLRTAKTEILTLKVKKTDAEISVLAKQISGGQASADALSFEELMYSATLTPSLDEKVAIYTAATKKGTNWNAHNNLAASFIAQAIENPSNAAGLADKAQAQLDLAARIQTTPEVTANMASVSMYKGNAYAAFSNANKALGSGLRGDNAAGVNGVKCAAGIVIANYGEAVKAGSASANTANNLYNKGLAQVLSKDYQNALTSFGEASRADSKHAMAFYGAAVASARLGNADGVVSNLTNAVKVDPSLKTAALADLEFSKWSTSEAFRSALR